MNNNDDIEDQLDTDTEMLMGGTSSAPSTPSRKQQQAEYGSFSKPSSTTAPSSNTDIAGLNNDNAVVVVVVENEPQRPPIDPCLWVFHFVEGLTAFSALLLLVTQMGPLVVPLLINAGDKQHHHVREQQDHPTHFVAFIERIYISVFCILVIITESSAPIPIVRDSQILQQYISRGFLYSFIGIVCLEESYSERVKALLTDASGFQILWAAFLMQISAWWLLAMGMLYMVLGILCMKMLRDRMAEREHRTWQTYRKDKEAWKRKRDQQRHHHQHHR